jgi:hypothetical protein
MKSQQQARNGATQEWHNFVVFIPAHSSPHVQQLNYHPNILW